MSRSASIATTARDRLAAERELAEFRSGFLRSRRRLARVARSGRPIVVGPFVSEVGFEALYWVPMLRWFVGAYGIDPGRVTAFSRGGPVSWYGGIAGHYVDVFEQISPQELKRLQATRVRDTNNEKQLRRGHVERELLAGAGLDHGSDVIDPSLMYQLLWAVWARRRPIERVLEHVDFRPFPEPPPGETSPRVAAALDSLPQRFVAVKPYFSGCFPDTFDNRRFLADLLARLTASGEVVLLSTGIDLDEHDEYTSAAHRVTTVSQFMDPSDNLELQSAVVRRAQALYTTYGGFAHLGPFLGAPTLAFYSEQSFNPLHLDVMQRATSELRHSSEAGFVLVHVSDAQLVERLGGSTLEEVEA